MAALGAGRVSTAGGQDGSDPWAAEAALRPSPRPVASPPGLGPETARKYRVELRSWSDNKRLDLDVNPEGFVAWRDRALGCLAGDGPDVRRFLLWAEKQPPTIDQAGEKKGPAEVGLSQGDVEHVSYVRAVQRRPLAERRPSRPPCRSNTSRRAPRSHSIPWQSLSSLGAANALRQPFASHCQRLRQGPAKTQGTHSLRLPLLSLTPGT